MAFQLRRFVYVAERFWKRLLRTSATIVAASQDDVHWHRRAVAAVPLMTTQAMAQKEGEDPGAGGKCDDGLVVSKKTGKCAVPKKKKPANRH